VPGMYGHAFRTHSIERVLQELEVHKHSTYTFFADDIFTANKKRCKDLLRGMIDRDLAPRWGAQVRTETVDDPELLKLMQDSGCFNVYVGFESINPRTLELFQKKQDLAKIERSIERFHSHEIRIHGMFVVGSDEDDVETIEATAEFALKNDIDSIQFMILTPIPGSPDWERLYAHGDKYVISKNWQFYDGHHVVHQPRRMTPYELQVGAIDAMAKFYSWRGIARKFFKGDRYYAAIRYFGKRLIARLVAAGDVKAIEDLDWKAAYSARAGFEVSRAHEALHASRRWSLLGHYYDGPSPYGQFFRSGVSYYGVGLHFAL